MKNISEPILDLARRQGLVRARDVQARGFSRMALSTLARQGKLTRLSRGLYALPDRPVSEHTTLADCFKYRTTRSAWTLPSKPCAKPGTPNA